MPLALQAKILRLLEDGSVRRLGDTKPEKVDVRIVAATKRRSSGQDRSYALFGRISITA